MGKTMIYSVGRDSSKMKEEAKAENERNHREPKETNMSAETAQILSAQEQAIESGKAVMHGMATDRVLRFDQGHPRLRAAK